MKLKPRSGLTLFLSFCLLCWSQWLFAGRDSAALVFISDPSEKLSIEQCSDLNQKLGEYYLRNSCLILISLSDGDETGSPGNAFFQIAENVPPFSIGQIDSLDIASGRWVSIVVNTAGKTSKITVGGNLVNKVIPDICKDLTRNILDPSFESGNYSESLLRALEVITGAIQGTYKHKPALRPAFSAEAFLVPGLIFLFVMLLAIYFTVRHEMRIRDTMQTLDLNAADARNLLGIDRPADVKGSWKEFDGDGAEGKW
jgi:hypothetical protein